MSEVVIASTPQAQMLCLAEEAPTLAKIVESQTVPFAFVKAPADATPAAKVPKARAMSLLPTAIGVEGTLDYRVHAVKKADSETKVSLWHDTPLYVVTKTNKHTGAYHFICEIPKCTRKKYEIATDEEGTPIKQDEKKGVLREFKRGDLAFNYGCFPRTWEDPDFVHPDTGVGGDNDPIDVCEIGLRQVPVGGVRTVKVLGVLAMIDDGETDWKVGG
jgi:inorganic pyrophosphatase